MPGLSYKLTIVAEHQQHLKSLGINAKIGDILIWAEIKKLYKKQSLLVHPDKGGSKDAFYKVNTAFVALECLADNVNHYDPLGGFALMDKTKAEWHCKLSEMHEAGLAIPVTTTININGREITCINNIEAYGNECEKKRADEAWKYGLNALGSFAFVLGASVIGCVCISFMAGKYQRNASENCIASLCGTGLIIGGGFLVANSFFERKSSTEALDIDGTQILAVRRNVK